MAHSLASLYESRGHWPDVVWKEIYAKTCLPVKRDGRFTPVFSSAVSWVAFKLLSMSQFGPLHYWLTTVFTTDERTTCFLWLRATVPHLVISCIHLLPPGAPVSPYLLWRRAHPVPGLRSHTGHAHGRLCQCWSHLQMNSRFLHSRCQSTWRAARRQTTQLSKLGSCHSCSRWWRENMVGEVTWQQLMSAQIKKTIWITFEGLDCSLLLKLIQNTKFLSASLNRLWATYFLN